MKPYQRHRGSCICMHMARSQSLAWKSEKEPARIIWQLFICARYWPLTNPGKFSTFGVVCSGSADVRQPPASVDDPRLTHAAADNLCWSFLHNLMVLILLKHAVSQFCLQH